MRSSDRFSLPLLVAVVAVLLPLTTFAAPADTNAEPRTARLVAGARAIEWHSAADFGVTVLSVQRPDGEVLTETFAAGWKPMLKLAGLADGLYSYELRFAQADGAPLVQTGSFTIANGAVVPADAVEGAVAGRPSRVVANTYFADDVAARDGVCAGFDCTNAETYGLASAKLKENNTRLKFEDTSGAGFASTDWQLSANDTTSGGANKFFVEDLTALTVPLLIEGGTPNNALYLDSTGRVGLRTSTPARDLTISVPVSAGIRMEQSASPFQAWDIVANNANFYIRDVNHEGNPFLIRTEAPNHSLVIDTTGWLGLGVTLPSYPIHHSSGARLEAGDWVNASSRAVKEDIHQLDAGAAFDALEALQPVTFVYKANPAENHVGFIAEDVPDLVATSDRKGLSSMDLVAVLAKVVKEQQRTIEDLQTRMRELERKK